MTHAARSVSGAPVSRGAFLSALGLAGVSGATIPSERATASPRPAIAVAAAGVHDVRDYGATGDGVTDDSGAFQAVLDDVAANGRGVVYVPPGDYRFATRAVCTAGAIEIAIVGDGQGISNLYSDNAAGVIKLDTGRQCQITVRDLSFFAARQGGGTALEVTRPRGDRHHRTLTVLDVEMRGVRSDQDYFDHGLRALDQVNPLVSNTIVAGPFTGGVNQDRTETSLLYAATCGIQLDGSYAPVVENCYVWSASTGYSLVSPGAAPAPEGGWFHNCSAVGVRVGFDIRTPDSLEPGLALERCHANGRDIGVRLRRMQFSITHCLFYNSLPGDDYTPDTAPEYTDVQIDLGWAGVLSNNIFRQPFNNNRTGISVAKDGTGFDETHAGILIKDNVFSHPGTAVSVAPAVANVVVAGNQFDTGIDPLGGAQLLTSVLDDRSGNATFASDRLRAATLLMDDPQPVPTGSWTTVRWQTADVDTDGFWDAAAPESLVVPTGRGVRFVELVATVAWQADGGGRRGLRLHRNGQLVPAGAAVRDNSSTSPSPPGGKDVQSVRTAVIRVQEGDVLTLHAWQSSGRSLDLVPGPETTLSAVAVNG